AWITELKNTQSCFFYLLSLFCFVKWRHAQPGRSRNWLYVSVLSCFVLAVLSKSSTVMLPAILVLCVWWMDGRWQWRNMLPLSPLFMISLAASGWTIWEQKFHSGALGEEWSQTLPERGIIAGKVVWFYLGKLVWPHPLMFIYPRWNIDAANM